jgi:ABC-type transport system involved in cytochrome c biogenesis permease subunit
MTESEAFLCSVAQLGGADVIASEFHKLNQGTWLPVKLVAGLGLMLALALMTFAIVQLNAGKINLLLAGHVFLVSMGYAATFLIGALGVCFVAQRCFSNFSPSRMRSVTGVTFALGWIAVSMTLLGVILGMVWAKIEWGRYWRWDIREIGGLAIILWQVFFLSAHRFTRASVRGLLTMSLLGNIVVSLGWFGGNMLSSPAPFSTAYQSLLLIGVACNLAFFVAGLAPAAWIRFRKAYRL